MAERARQYRRDRAGQFARTPNSPPEDVLRRPVRGVLEPTEQAAVQEVFGVGPEQVLRDHAISHTLAAIATVGADDVVFFGGTALSRTQLPDLRLSEDIDLIARGNRRSVAERIESAIESELGRSLGTVTFEPPLSATKGSEPSVLAVGTSRFQIQLLRGVDQPAWPTEVIDIEQRYSDAPPARVRVLTPAAQVAAKLAAWHDRAAPRDLYDLWALASSGAISGEAARVFGRLGPLTEARSIQFTRIPTDAEWEAALGHQCIIEVTPAEAARVIRDAIKDL
ncbi:nucleotidyl transferase AbiEii/AbiGii toxin family protein [Microbacterium gorillae]|uniref:nucleotidyl transferase AbiEii/AbiGii toxin family protein n=1 Tax=Microbacterium gorillae TaxID=1231063 RepID=UPI003D95736A